MKLRIRRRVSAVLGTLGLCLAMGVVFVPTVRPADVVSAAVPTSATDESLVPHYFGPYPNWANSPQTLANAVVAITGGGGTGATAVANVMPKNPTTGAVGSIPTITVTNPGSGYTSAPTVTITAPGVVPAVTATATAQISNGAISTIDVVDNGVGYSEPLVAIAGAPGAGATAQATGSVDVDVTIVSGGSGYAINPVVVFSLPEEAWGRQAMGMATMTAGGVVDSVTVTDPGDGYRKAPTVTITDAGAVNATAATVKATINVNRIDVTAAGSGYVAPTVTITDKAPGTGSSATAVTTAATGAVTGITVTNPGAGYLTPGLRKFVNTLAGFNPATPNNLGEYIPIAVPDTVTYPGTDYYEIGLVQYRQKFHTDLQPSLLRGYVQLSTGIVVGNHTQLTNANVNPAVPDVNIAGYFGVDRPHYLGPTIVATKDRPVRILFRNLLPTEQGGDLFLPVDTTLMGSGAGPDMMTLDANGVPMDMAADLGTVLDGVRNPMCGETPKPATCYSENRATLHLHGGVTPWISDGTPHQWITPAGEGTAYPQGVSVSNVPDMPDPGPGAQTFFYTNQQSARLMFYHDHAWGITRLNVYAGEAAGYLLTDPIEQSLIAADTDPVTPGNQPGALAGLGTGMPLIVQDKTFVPSVAQMAKVDPTWQYAKWGGAGNLWVPHVYMPAQNPGDPSGMSSFGRWMYGPWFWPPAKDAKYPPIANPYYDPTCDPDVQPFCEPALIPSTPNVSVGMEMFHDTPLVNGTAYPTTTVDPKAYRYRVLNASDDRFWNLSWYVADPRTGTLSEVALKQTELDAAQTDPVVFPTPDTGWSPKGPNWIQIGTEGGFLPDPVVVPAHETTWITDPTRFDVGNVDQHSLLLAPAERADVIVDFSQFRGRTLILYNDAPAAFPARVPGYDYYTGGPDMGPAGAPTTLPGFGPNTRTIMQVKVSLNAAEAAFDKPGTDLDRFGALKTAFAHHLDAQGKPAGVFEKGSDPIIVGQAAYNKAYGSTFVGTGWCNSPTTPTARCDGFARIQEQGAPPGQPDTFRFKFDTLGSQPWVTLGTQLSIPFEPKGIHDEMNSANFDEWGRMTANLGLEAPGATPLLQNIILYPYPNPATEILDSNGMPSSLAVTPISSAADGTQIWKITHNGVDTHPIHWHLYDVQVLNRVTWDNIIIPPEPTELGWKETVRVSPLEDTIVALRPIVPTLPFAVPDSKRPLNPMMPIGARGSQNGAGTEAGFNNTDVLGNPIAPIVNTVTNFGWEYVFHCHILSHEEMDMMRPVSVNVRRALPMAPALSATRTTNIVLTWTDGTPVNYLDPTSWTNPGTAEVGFRVERAPGASGGSFVTVSNSLANSTSFADNTANINQTWRYRVTAWNAAGDSRSNIVTVSPPVILRATTTTVTSSRNPSTFGQFVSFTAAVRPQTGTGIPTGTVRFTIDGVTPANGVVTLNALGNATYSTSSLVAGSHAVVAVYNADATFATSTSATLTQTVNKAGSTTTVTSNRNPMTFAQNPVTFTARVTPVGNLGTVQFRIDGANVGSPLALDATGRANLTVSLAVGTHTVQAVYSGSANYNTSTSTTLNELVNP